MSKFQRTFTMTVQGRSGKVYTFTDPLTCVFDINRRSEGGLNSAHFMIYNLSAATRNDIEYDSAIDLDNAGFSTRRPFQFKAGYKTEGYQPVLFEGTIKKAFYYRDSGPDIVTEIDVTSGLDAIQKAQIQSSQASPWDGKNEARKILNTMRQYGVTEGAVGSLFDGLTSERGVVWLGSAWNVLKRYAQSRGGRAFIDNQKVYVLGPNDVLNVPGALPQLDATTGLIGTPRRSAHVVNADMLFEPRMQLMQQLRLVSSVTKTINGTFSVQALCHRGIISGAKDGGVVTSLELVEQPKEVTLVTPT